ncbi:MAG: oligoendopeptidase F [Treponemataceae bacterium]|nr:MAG: oligoendopeptidase F [Treponemataceae bacterium]
MDKIVIPLRKDVSAEHKWDLSTLYSSDADWEAALAQCKPLVQKIIAFKGKLAESKDALLQALEAFFALEEIAEAAGCYASLLTSGDEGDSAAQEKMSRFVMTVTACEAQTSFFIPEIQAVPDDVMDAWLTDDEFAQWRVTLTKLRKLKPFTLGEKEEKILALQQESAQAAHKAFSALTNVDFDFGSIPVDGAEKPLTQSTWAFFREHPDRAVRKQAYEQFYGAFDRHRNTIAALYEGSVNHDVFLARSRGYPSSRRMALFPDNVSESVYDNLVSAVRQNFAPLHKYYALRKKILKLDELRHYDVGVPLAPKARTRTTYEQAVEILRDALSPLGAEYTGTLCKGLLGGWVDRYENKGKRSGAFSSGAYKSYPYILLNYDEDVLRDVFTMAHEGGHSMHSWYSARENPFQHYQYTIFEAEVASTFNEELLFKYMLDRAEDDSVKAYLLGMRADDIAATLYRQTMFAEFEAKTHAMVESGEPLTVDSIRAVYGGLLRDYFGPEMVFEPVSDLEGMRIPHFYSAFYVYKYATGISAALALADRVLSGGASERDDYFAFLKSGGSRYPIDALKVAGVDMERAEPVQKAAERFADTVSALEKLC